MASNNSRKLHENSEDMHTLQLDGVDRVVYIGASSIIGRRPEQQDTVRTDTYYDYLENESVISVLCDGMGGLSGGEKASALCASIVYDTFHSREEFPTVADFFRNVIYRADDEVSRLKAEDGTLLKKSGTTMVSVVIDGEKLYWASVGDSRIYIVRGKEIICATTDHNYMMLLNERVKRGEISREQADSDPKKEALISFIGMGGVQYIDLNVKPLLLADGDIIVLCSDGLYRSVTPQEIGATVTQFGEEPQIAAQKLTDLAMSKQKRHQDNTSVIVIRYKNAG